MTDNSAMAYLGKPIIRRRVLATVWVNKSDAQDRANKEAQLAMQTGVIP